MTSSPCLLLRYSRHALERMFQRSISPEAVEAVVQTGEVIASYPDDRPFPSRLILGWRQGKPVHVLIAQDPDNQLCQVVTVYNPDPALWDADFKRRKTS
jgi:hypothetical protein